MRILAPKHLQTKFIKLNAERAPFFITKLSVRVLPTVVVFHEGVAKSRLTGFDGLVGDEFKTADLERLLKFKGAFKRVEKVSDLSSDDDDDDEERREGATVAELLEQRRAHVLKSMLAEDVVDDEV